MQYKIPLIKNPFYKNDLIKKKLSSFILKTNMLSMGKNCTEFEIEFSKFQGRKYTVLFNSGSSANLALIQSLINLKLLNKTDHIGFTAIGWPTTIMPVIQLGLTPVPIDINVKYLNSTLDEIKKTTKILGKHGKKLSAIFITNVLGASGNLKDIKAFCKKNSIILLEDNCEALGSEYLNKKLGNFGLASTFSFFIGHHFSCIEGGAVSTDNKNLFNMLKMVRSHGWDRHLDKNSQLNIRAKHRIDTFYAKYTFYHVGMNLRPTEATGYLGLIQLPYLERIIQKRQENYNYFLSCISRKKGKIIDVYADSKLNINSNFAFPIIMGSKQDSNRARQIFDSSKIEIRPIIGGNLVEQPFFKNQSLYGIDVPNTKLATSQGFYFGNDPSYTKAELNYIRNVINLI